MDVIKRLVQTCVLQVPYLPLEMRNNCLHLIEQVKHYTASEPPFPHQELQPPPPPPHLMGPHQMMGFMGRPPPPNSHFEQRDQIREIGHPSEAFRYPMKEPSLPSTSDSAISLHKERGGTLGKPSFAPVPEATPSPESQANSHTSQKLPESEGKSEKDAESNNSQENNEEGEKEETILSNNKEGSEPVPNGKNGSIIGSKRTVDSETGSRNNNSPGKKQNIGNINEELSIVPQHKNHRPDSHNSNKNQIMVPYVPIPKVNMNGSYPPYHVPPYPIFPDGFHGGSSFPHPRNNAHHMPSPYNHMPPFPPNAPYPPPPPNFSQFPPPDFPEPETKPGVPQSLSVLGTLQHGDVVCAASFSKPFNYVFTGSKGVVKIWDVNDVARPRLLSSIDCLVIIILT